MGSFAVAVGTPSLHPEFMCLPGVGKKAAVGNKIRMASYTIFVHHFPALFLNEDHLGFPAQGEYRCMPKPVLRLEIVLVYKIIMRNMAIVAVGDLSVGAVHPGLVLGRHDMAVDAGLGFVAQI